VAARDFEVAEVKLLIDAIQSSKFITERKSNELIKKVKKLVSAHQAAQLQRQVYVQGRIKTMNESIYYNVDKIHNAISKNTPITFKYFDYNGEKKKVYRHDGTVYKVSPCALIWDDEKYYLVAYDENEGIIKNFRVDKMQGVTVTNDVKSEEASLKKFNPADYSKKIFGMYGGTEELVTLECRERLAGAIIDRFGMEPVFIKTDFGFKFSIRAMVSPNFFSWVLGFGTDMRVLAPKRVREELLSNLREISGNYENKTN
jgi:predicted DNA-binding transcriptional regulator YafY